MTEGCPRGTRPYPRRAARIVLVAALAALALPGAAGAQDRAAEDPSAEAARERDDQERLDCRRPRNRLEERQCAERRSAARQREQNDPAKAEAEEEEIVILQAPVGLATAESFAVLAGSTVTNTGPSVISGDVGVSPGSAVVGFPPGIVVNGTIHAADAVAAQAQSDLTVAYNDAAGRACDVTLTGQDLGGLTLTSGVYCFAASAQLTGTLTLDAQGDPDAVFIFQIGSTLTTASSSSVNLINSAQPCNVYWQVGSSATLGTTTSFVGTVMALASITANTSATVEGRLLARTGAVTLDSNVITTADCAPPPPPGDASITIAKETEPDSAEDFQFTGSLGTFVLDDDLTSATPRQITFDVTPGTFTVTESAEANFDLESITCTGGTTTVNLAQRRVIIEAEDGDSITCVFLNESDADPPPPPGDASITIVKETEPDSAQNFSFSGSLGAFILDDDLTSATPRQRIFVVDPGEYTVTEAATAGFDLDSITCTGGTATVNLAQRRVVIDAEADETITCVFVNQATTVPPPPPGDASITIVKETEPDSAQNFTFSGDLGTFILDDDLTSATPRQLIFTVDPGTFTVTELAAAGFDLDSITCTGGQTSVNLGQRRVVIDADAGDVITCVFVNQATAIPPPPPGDASITIVKETEPDGPQSFLFTGDLGDFVLDDDLLSATPRQRIFTVVPGGYVVTESAAAGFDLDSITCTGGQTSVDLAQRRVLIDASAGDTIICVFVNQAAVVPPPSPGDASITIVKETEPDGPQSFLFSGDLGDFILDDDLLSATPRQRIFIVNPGNYSVIESATAGFDLDSITCTGGRTSVNLAQRRVLIDAGPGDVITCVFVNVLAVAPPPPPPGQGSITIVKDTIPDDPANFAFSGDLGRFILDDDLLSATPRQRRFDLDPGVYTITEEQLPGGARFRLDSIRCSGGRVQVDLDNRSVTIRVQAGDVVTCVFVNVARRTGPRPPTSPPPPGGPGGPGGPGRPGGGLAETGLAIGGLLALGALLVSTGGGLLHAGRHRPRRRGGRHRPGAARAWANATLDPL